MMPAAVASTPPPYVTAGAAAAPPPSEADDTAAGNGDAGAGLRGGEDVPGNCICPGPGVNFGLARGPPAGVEKGLAPPESFSQTRCAIASLAPSTNSCMDPGKRAVARFGSGYELVVPPPPGDGARGPLALCMPLICDCDAAPPSIAAYCVAPRNTACSLISSSSLILSNHRSNMVLRAAVS